MTKDEALKVVFPALQARIRAQADELEPGDIDLSEGFCDLDATVSLGDWDQVEHKFGKEVADALFDG